MSSSVALVVCASLALLRRTSEGVVVLTVTRRTGTARCKPGGKSDPGETPIETAVRETQEETGVQVPPACLHGGYRGGCPTPTSATHDVHVFWAWWSPEFGEPRTIEPGIEPAWVRVEDYLAVSAFPDFDGRAWAALALAVPEALASA